jgi:hypothetical protein
VNAHDIEELADRRRARYYRDDPVRWIWILYGLAQATVSMLMAFSVIEGTTVAAVVTAVALIVYVGVNEIWVRPIRTRARTADEHEQPAGSPLSGEQLSDAQQQLDPEGDDPAASTL